MYNHIPPIVHQRKLNPLIEFGTCPFTFPREAGPSPSSRMNDAYGNNAGVSSFGYGGAMAHTVLCAYDRRTPAVRARFVYPAERSEPWWGTPEDEQAVAAQGMLDTTLALVERIVYESLDKHQSSLTGG